VTLRGEGLCAALNLRDSILCGDKIKFASNAICAAKSIYQIYGLPRLGIPRCNSFGRAHIFTARVICSEILILQRRKFDAL